jgi:transposase-like protein
MKITDEIKIQINELYLELGVKKKVADIVGCSPATVSKYIIEGYVSQKDREPAPEFDESKIIGPAALLDMVNSWQEFADACMLTAEEWAEMKEIQKGVMI